MADDQNRGSDAEGNGKSATQRSDTIAMSAYKKLQGDLQKANNALKELRVQSREGQSAEAQLAEVQAELVEKNRELNTLRLKSQAPKELHDYIDKQLAKGRELDDEDIEDLVARLPKSDSKDDSKEKPDGKSTESQKETSGVRNSGPKTPDNDADVDAFLKGVNVKDALGL